MAKKHPGIEVRHEKDCRSSEGGRCNCAPSYRAHVWSARDGKLVRRTFRNLAEARAWRADAQVALREGTLRMPSRVRVDQAADQWLAGARDGSIRTRSGDRYKPSAIRSYDDALNLRVLPSLGAYRLTDLRRSDVQDFIDGLLAEGLSPSTIRNTLMPLRAIYRRALARGDVGINPTAGVELPAVRGTRDRIASPEEAASLIEALPADDRALWATAFYAGLRLGELLALRWSDVDLAAGVIRVEGSWDRREGPIEPKSRAGRRSVPIPAMLRDYLIDQRVRVQWDGLVFGRSPEKAFNPSGLTVRARRIWKKAKQRRITLHECRHTFASLMIAAGVNGKALSTYMGHSTIQVTFDRYGHLMPGSEEEAAQLLDAYLAERASAQARFAGSEDASEVALAGE